MKCEVCVTDSVILMCWCVCVLFDFIGVRVRACARPQYVCVRACLCGLEETVGETECFRWLCLIIRINHTNV